MGSRSRMLASASLLCVLAAACGGHDDDNNDNTAPRRTATPAVSPTPVATPAAHACPSRVTYIVNGTSADLDTGWTGIYADQPLAVGGSLSFALACPGATLGNCGVCPLTGPVASTTTINNRRCVNASNVECTTDADCPGSTCAFFFGPQVPVSAGGFPICFTNRIVGPVTGTLSPELGAGTASLPLVAALFSGISTDMPCPTCSGAILESTGTCVGGDRAGMPCTVHGTTGTFGNVSFDCPASTGGRIAEFDVPLDLSTGTRDLPPTAICAGTGGGSCWCPGQQQPNACDDAVCTVGADDEGTCANGPVDQLCAIDGFRSCTTNGDCPASGDSCQLRQRDCLGPTDASGAASGAISRTGTPSQATPTLVAAFCLDATTSPAVNTAAGFPGPAALRLPTVICIEATCPSSPPSAP